MLTVRQPWAYLIASGEKAVENRSWPTRHRGDLVIHAATSRVDHVASAARWGVPELGPDHFGVLYAVVEVVDCLPVDRLPPGDHVIGPWCFLLRNPRVLAPIRVRGRLGIVPLPDAVAAEVLGQLRGRRPGGPDRPEKITQSLLIYE